jgi:uncharacterized protein involved in copper resistance
MCAGATQVDQSAAEHLAHAVPQPAPTQLPPGAAYPPQPTAGPPPSAPPPAPDYLSDGPPPEWNRGTQ